VARFGLNELALLALSLPRHVAKVSALEENYEKRTGAKLVVVSGARTQAQQAATYADSTKTGAQTYRASPPGQSKHERGAATDLNVVGHTIGDAAQDARSSWYAILAEEAEKVGLKPGLRFKDGLPDPYHVEEPETLAQLDAEYSAFLRGRLWRGALVAAALLVIGWWLVTRTR
jgi:hypothetical protein